MNILNTPELFRPSSEALVCGPNLDQLIEERKAARKYLMSRFRKVASTLLRTDPEDQILMQKAADIFSALLKETLIMDELLKLKKLNNANTASDQAIE